MLVMFIFIDPVLFLAISLFAAFVAFGAADLGSCLSFSWINVANMLFG